jgi:hypothetical protein
VAVVALKSSEDVAASVAARHSVVVEAPSKEWAKVEEVDSKTVVAATRGEVAEAATGTTSHSGTVTHPFRSSLIGICLRKLTSRAFRS